MDQKPEEAGFNEPNNSLVSEEPDKNANCSAVQGTPATLLSQQPGAETPSSSLLPFQTPYPMDSIVLPSQTVEEPLPAIQQAHAATALQPMMSDSEPQAPAAASTVATTQSVLLPMAKEIVPVKDDSGPSGGNESLPIGTLVSSIVDASDSPVNVPTAAVTVPMAFSGDPLTGESGPSADAVQAILGTSNVEPFTIPPNVQPEVFGVSKTPSTSSQMAFPSSGAQGAFLTGASAEQVPDVGVGIVDPTGALLPSTSQNMVPSQVSLDRAAKIAESKKRRRKMKDKEAPKKPRSAYIVYLDSHREEVRREQPDMKMKDITTALAEKWKFVGPDELAECKRVAENERTAYEHAKKIYLEMKAAAPQDFPEPDRPKAKRAKKDKEAPKKGRSAFILFLMEFRQRNKQENNSSRAFADVSKQVGEAWAKLTDDERRPYLERAQLESDSYEEKKKEYFDRKQVASVSSSAKSTKAPDPKLDDVMENSHAMVAMSDKNKAVQEPLTAYPAAPHLLPVQSALNLLCPGLQAAAKPVAAASEVAPMNLQQPLTADLSLGLLVAAMGVDSAVLAAHASSLQAKVPGLNLASSLGGLLAGAGLQQVQPQAEAVVSQAAVPQTPLNLPQGISLAQLALQNQVDALMASHEQLSAMPLGTAAMTQQAPVVLDPAQARQALLSQVTPSVDAS
ncbi:hypothetical protein CYMTET_28832 [Cymbomonas tetramitiformis]|uniref:HMG box domain-containing protein n=1 Tax=Cymbomonas tetramitiformis TaxID=36881 RepID=A0AAE0KVS8_9CHLO|nr:hypothetical protein CYMTET_28832 [Cymbomonas tetramitiformis]